jgi:hypothetical protein
MWPFTRNPESRMHHRILARLRLAYLVTEDLPAHDLQAQNLRQIGTALQLANDDPVLFQSWNGTAMPTALAHAILLEQRAWQLWGNELHELAKQQFTALYFPDEARKLEARGKALQELLHLEALLLTRQTTSADNAALDRLAKVLA